MSRILDSHLDAERLAQCAICDRCMEAGEPIRDVRIPTNDAAIPAALRRTQRPHPVAHITAKMALACGILGFVAGQLVAPTERPPTQRMQMDKRDVQRTPGVPAQRQQQRVVV